MIKILNVPSLYSSLYEVVNFCKTNSGEVEIVVPDKLSLFMEKFLFERMGISASFDIKVSTLNRFAKKSCPIAKEKQISKIGSILLIYKILKENYDKLSVLKSQAYSFTYAENIYRTIAQLKASKITLDEMKTFTSPDKQLEGKIQDLALVYENYEFGKAGLLDASDMFLMSTLSVAEGRENAKILFVGFDDFTAIEYAIIERLAMVAEVNVLNYSGKASNKYIYNSEIISQLKDIAYVNELNFEIVDCNVNSSNLKNFLHNNLFGLNNEKFVLDNETIKLFTGNKVSDEIEFIARDIRNKILDGKHYENFGVAVFGLDSRTAKIKEIFEKYEINYYIDSEISINKSVFYKFLLSVFKYNLESYNLVHLLDIINSPFFKAEITEKQKLIEKLVAIKFRAKFKQLDKIDEGLQDIQQKLLEFLNYFDFDKDENLIDVKTKILNADNALDFETVMSEINTTIANVQNQIVLKKSRETIYNLFDEVLKFYDNATFETFYDIYTHITGVCKISNIPLTLDAVKVVDADNSMEVFDELYIINCTNENAPNLKYDCGIILDGEIERLNFSHKLSPTIAHINKLAKLRLFNMALLFEKALTITYSNTPSDIIKEFTSKIQVQLSNEVVNLVPFEDLKFSKYVTLSEWDNIEYLCKNDEKNKKLFEKLIKNKEINNISLNNLKIYNNLKTISSSALENYFKCPLLFFITNILKIKPRLNNEILSLDVGNILHDIMFNYYKANKQVGDSYEFCVKQVFKFVEHEERLKINMDSPVLKNLIDEAVRVIHGLNYIDENSKFKVRTDLLEVGFYDKHALKLSNIDIVGKVDRVDEFDNMLRIIDYKSGRADASLKELYFGNKLQLFLYANAIEQKEKKRIVGNFYLPLHNAYTREVSNTYSLKGFFTNDEYIVRALDKRLEAGGKSDIVNVRMNKEGKAIKTIGYKELETAQMYELKEYSKLVSVQAVDEIKSGYIKPSPSDISKPCEYCPYLHVCMKASNGLEYRQSDKVTLDSFKRGEDEEI